MSWHDAQAFCTWLSGKEQATCRLPTEAEWEYACRAGSPNLYTTPSHMAVLHSSNYADRSIREAYGDFIGAMYMSDGFPYTSPAGSYSPNAFGLYDTYGNVFEWCSDWHSPDYYENSPEADPQGPQEGEQRVMRAGCFVQHYYHLRCSLRGSDREDAAGSATGFRVVRETSSP